ncbi:MAG TPA: hypothetical protein VEA16_01380 [Vicinamibacterales bacterium]|nr:hypothetical protein [Vicinamibacterales bacterium]
MRGVDAVVNWLRRQWQTDRRLVGVFTAINGLVLANAILHTPFTNYDALDHIEYIKVLSQGRLPGPDDTGEFFAAPLAYAPPALLAALGMRWGAVLKVAQLQNVLFSIGLTASLVALCRRLRPGDVASPLWVLVLLGTVPLYYKMFAFVRGEPLTAFLSVLLVERVVAYAPAAGRLRDALIIGAVAGAALLSKQWALFVVVPVFGWMLWRRMSMPHLAAAAMTAVVIGGGFYASLWARFGSPAAFINEPAPAFRLDNRTAYFYTGLGWPSVFTHPVREALDQDGEIPLLPLLYADGWGDYWCYWVVRGTRESGGWMSGDLVAAAAPALSNRDAMAPYLGRVNLAGLVPTMVMLSGVALALGARRGHESPKDVRLPAIVVIATMAGYFTLLIGYPDLGVKSGYQLHLLPFLALLGGIALLRLSARPRAAVQLIIVLAALHNAPVFVTRYWWLRHW